MEKTVPIIDEEYVFDGDVIISQTDAKGFITYVNRKFCEVSGYSVDELVGKSHNLIRHPDMPKEVFKKMWGTIQDGQSWNGIIKNMRKDGKYYWVDTGILPIKDDNENITGYIASGREVFTKDRQEVEEIYQKMLETEKSGE